MEKKFIKDKDGNLYPNDAAILKDDVNEKIAELDEAMLRIQENIDTYTANQQEKIDAYQEEKDAMLAAK